MMMIRLRFVLAVLATVLLECGSAYAQAVGTSISPGPALGMTSPLGIGAAPPVARTGIPMGATEQTTSAVSPFISGTSPMPFATCGAASAGPSAGGTTSTMGTCAASGGISLGGAAPMASPGTAMGSSSPVAPVGIPMGSTEMLVGGVSPPSVGLTTNPAAPSMTPTTPFPGIALSNPSAPPSMLGSTSTTPCQETATGISRAGTPLSATTAFGAPLRGPALGAALDRGCAP
jgi:hypothetical protein